MAMATLPIYTYNNCIITIDGEETEINGYLQGVSYNTGTGAGHVQTLNPTGDASGTNLTNYSPRGQLNFAPGMLANFYAFLNGRRKFSLTINEYATGYLEGESHLIQIISAQLEQFGGNIAPMQTASTVTVDYIATKIIV